jgi:hypothetical protein
MKYSIIIPILILVTLSVAFANMGLPINDGLEKEMLPTKMKTLDTPVEQESDSIITLEPQIEKEITITSRPSSKKSFKKEEIEHLPAPIVIDFSPETSLQLTTAYHYWPSGILIEVLQDEGELEMMLMDVFFNEGHLDMVYEINDVVGGGYVEMEEGSLAYTIFISNKDENGSQYTLFYNIIESTIPQYNVGDQELYGGIAETGGSVDFSTMRMFEEFESNIIADTRRHMIYLNEGLFRNPEPGELLVDVTHFSMMDITIQYIHTKNR